MTKKKESNLRFFRFTARVWIISMPTVLVLALLVLLGKISPTTALGCLLGVIAFTAVITGAVFRELEKFISYLKNLSQGQDIEPPRFKKGVFSNKKQDKKAIAKEKNIYLLFFDFEFSI